MTTRAIGLVGVVLAALALVPARADAHRLDELLQATRVDIRADRIVLEIDVTTGALLAAEILDTIDIDRDGVLNDVERHQYAQQVLSSSLVSVDGRTTMLTLLAHEFPTRDAMAAGTGAIRVRAVAKVTADTGRHQLVVRSAPLHASSVYLVNALLPTDARVQLNAPRRDPAQRQLALEFDVSAEPAALRIAWVSIAITLLCLLVTVRYARSHGHLSRTRRALSNA
jgi:hypothetical protein